MKEKRAYLGIFLIIAATIGGLILIPLVVKKNTPPSTPEQSSTTSDTPGRVFNSVRKPAVAGQYYPKDPEELSAKLDFLLAQVEKINALEKGEKLRILIVPHAGLDYSGETAAAGFKQIEVADFSKVIIIGESHKTPLTGASVFSKGAWETPLGTVGIDEGLAEKIISKEQGIIQDENSHKQEHSLEMELIFLQKTLKDFKIIPILLDQPSEKLISDLALRLAYLANDETLVVVSTDLSHYPTWETANKVDGETIDAILTGEEKAFAETIKNILDQKYPNLATPACASSAVRTALQIAEILKVNNFQKIKYGNSGDITGDKSQVVGYASIGAFSKYLNRILLDENAQQEALEIANTTLKNYLNDQETPAATPESPFLYQQLGVFVTLEKEGQLRGCIGAFEPKTPLYETLRDTTVSSASKDPRFSPVKKEELQEIAIEISVLTPRRKIASWEDFNLGSQGIVIENGLKSGTFLPQVAKDTDWSKEKFLEELCIQKADLPKDCYKDPNSNIYVYEAQVFSKEKL